MRSSPLNNIEELLRGAPLRSATWRLPLLAATLVVSIAALAATWLYQPSPPVTGAETFALKALVVQFGDGSPNAEDRAWQRLQDRFGVATVYDLKSADFPAAVHFLATLRK